MHMSYSDPVKTCQTASRKVREALKRVSRNSSSQGIKMRAMTLQDHIDPLVQKIQKCYAPGCGPKSIQVMFTKPAGYIRDFEPVWVCSSGHCSDYEDIPSLEEA
jgi:hypothetical protein